MLLWETIYNITLALHGISIDIRELFQRNLQHGVAV